MDYDSPQPGTAGSEKRMFRDREKSTSNSGAWQIFPWRSRQAAYFRPGLAAVMLVLLAGQAAVALWGRNGLENIFFTAAFILLLLIQQISHSLQRIAEGLSNSTSNPANTVSKKDVSDI